MIIIIISFFLFVLFLYSSNRNKKTLSTISFILFALILLLTNGQFQGNDYPHYLNFYLGESSMFGTLDIPGGYELEKPYAYFVEIVRFILPRSSYSYILCYSLMWICPLFLLLKKGSNNVALSLFLLCTLLGCSQLLFIIAAQRQMIATVSFLWIYYILEFSDFSKWKKRIFFIVLSLIALLAHSSSYFVLPLLLAIYFIRFPTKKYLYIIIILSFVIGPVVQDYLAPVFYGFMISLGSSDEIARSTEYFINQTYNMGESRYVGLLPSTLMSLIFLYYYDKEELKTYGSKCFISAVILFNFFNYIPLFNRALNALFIFGVILGIPLIKRKQQVMGMKLYILIVAVGLMYTTIKRYNDGANSNGLFPYPYIWENSRVL
mgnify:CR=1 FL=1